MRPSQTDPARLVDRCQALIHAYRTGALGNCELPEDDVPVFASGKLELKMAYFTLPMALNYRRNSTQLWKAALATYKDPATCDIFSVASSARLPLDELREKLLQYKMAMQPTRHTLTWSTIARTVDNHWGSFANLLDTADYDFLALRELIQRIHRQGFPYLAGPKLFNYWCFILGLKCGIELKHKEYIAIAVDSHVLKCSVRLGVVSAAEVSSLPTTKIAERWGDLLRGSKIAPTDLNVPLWFWSRNGFRFEV